MTVPETGEGGDRKSVFLHTPKVRGDVGYSLSGVRVKAPVQAGFPPSTPTFPDPGCKPIWPS